MICADPFCQLPNDGHRHEGLRDLADSYAEEVLDRIRQKMAEWQDATRKAGVYREGDPDQRMAKWVQEEAAEALARLRGAA